MHRENDNSNRGSGPNTPVPPGYDPSNKKKDKAIKQQGAQYFPTPAQLRGIECPWAKNAIPPGTMAVMMFSNTGAVECGITRENPTIYPFEDLMAINRIHEMAKESVKDTKKKEIETNVSYYANSQVDEYKTWVPAPRYAEIALETISSLRCLNKNVQLIARNICAIPSSRVAKKFLLEQAKSAEEALKARSAAALVYDGDKASIDLRAWLLVAGGIYSIFNKLISGSDIASSTEHDLTRVVFPKNPSKGLVLSVAEIRNDAIMGSLYRFPLVQERSGPVLLSAIDQGIETRATAPNGTVDPALVERYLRQSVNIVGPGPVELNWAKPIPSRPVSRDLFAAELLMINKENLDFHLGVNPLSITGKVFWDNKVTNVNVVTLGLQKSAGTQAMESAIALNPGTGFNRDPLCIDQYYRINTFLRGRALSPAFLLTYNNAIGMLPGAAADRAVTALKDPDLYDLLPLKQRNFKRLAFVDRKADLAGMIDRLFLRPMSDRATTPKTAKSRSGQIRIPKAIQDEIRAFQIKNLLSKGAAETYSSFLKGLHMLELVEKAHISFASEIEQLDLFGLIDLPVDSEEDGQ